MLLRSTKQKFTNMRVLWQPIVWALMVVMTAAQPQCDPLTQYEMDGHCCKMCGPGFSMSSLSTCWDPQCQDCGEDDYQDKYTKQPKCERRPYCDSNLNFETPVHDKKKRTICTCKVGFHCSTEQCITCNPHSPCKPGYGAKSKGDHLRDTVCEKCPNGTFSSETSLDGVCQKWTECGHGQRIERSGTDTSDNICVGTQRTHVVVLAVVIPLIVVGLLVASVIWQCRGDQHDARGQVKSCVESCMGGSHEPLRGDTLITTPTDAQNVDEESSCPHEMQSSQEDGFIRTPEEIEDPTDVGSTDRGNFVTQETGKTAVLSRQESQPHTYGD
uniref:CD40 n=1 Tax=Lutjanus sanguineus TaxID=264213 RepID=T1RP61_9TELE|nr:CD40 [Lutjanus sanguineus]